MALLPAVPALPPMQAAAEAHQAAVAEAEAALGRSGIPSLMLEEALAQLQAGATSRACA